MFCLCVVIVVVSWWWLNGNGCIFSDRHWLLSLNATFAFDHRWFVLQDTLSSFRRLFRYRIFGLYGAILGPNDRSIEFVRLLDTIYPDQPMFGCVSLFQIGEVKVLVANDRIASTIEARRATNLRRKLTTRKLNVSENTKQVQYAIVALTDNPTSSHQTDSSSACTSNNSAAPELPLNPLGIRPSP